MLWWSSRPGGGGGVGGGGELVLRGLGWGEGVDGERGYDGIERLFVSVLRGCVYVY